MTKIISPDIVYAYLTTHPNHDFEIDELADLIEKDLNFKNVNRTRFQKKNFLEICKKISDDHLDIIFENGKIKCCGSGSIIFECNFYVHTLLIFVWIIFNVIGLIYCSNLSEHYGRNIVFDDFYYVPFPK